MTAILQGESGDMAHHKRAAFSRRWWRPASWGMAAYARIWRMPLIRSAVIAAICVIDKPLQSHTSGGHLHRSAARFSSLISPLPPCSASAIEVAV